MQLISLNANVIQIWSSKQTTTHVYALILIPISIQVADVFLVRMLEMVLELLLSLQKHVNALPPTFGLRVQTQLLVSALPILSLTPMENVSCVQV
jgi:hypothetical protein